MIHGEGLTVEVCGEQGLWMAGRRQVELHKVRVRIPRGIEIDRGLHTRPFRLRHRWVGAKQIIESQTSPPRDRTPAFNATGIPPINAEWVGAGYTPEQARTPQQKQLLSLSDSLLAELDQADEYVIGVPMHNFGVPSVLMLWIDQIARVGRTFLTGREGQRA
jgi:hypothetical protein